MEQFWATIAATLVAGIFGHLLYRFIFEDFDDLWDCVASIVSSPIFAFFRGEIVQGMKQSLKLVVFLTLVGWSAWTTFDLVVGFGKEKEISEENSTPISEHLED